MSCATVRRLSNTARESCTHTGVHGRAHTFLTATGTNHRPVHVHAHVHVGRDRRRLESKDGGGLEALRKAEVVLTTYETLVADIGDKEPAANNDGDDGHSRGGAGTGDATGGGGGVRGGGLCSVRWYRVVLDEAQTIRNPASQVAKAAGRLCAVQRLCLTGTPFNNSEQGGLGQYNVVATHHHRHPTCPLTSSSGC